MCIGMNHCADCESRGNDADVIAYVALETHEMPKIADAALRNATQMRRRKNIADLAKEGRTADFLALPETMTILRGIQARKQDIAGYKPFGNFLQALADRASTADCYESIRRMAAEYGIVLQLHHPKTTKRKRAGVLRAALRANGHMMRCIMLHVVYGHELQMLLEHLGLATDHESAATTAMAA